MEGGALSDQEFPEFAKEVIPFLHTTTKIEGHPYDGLLLEKGFRGFPSLAFMDAEGNVIATHQGERSVKAFRKTHADVKAYQDLQARIAKGEKGLDYALFVAEWNLGSLDYDKAKARAEAMGKSLTAEQKKEAKQIVQDLEVLKHANALSMIRDQAQAEAAADEAGKHFHGMFTDGYRPGPKAEARFWGLLANWADKNGKIESLEQAVAWMNKTYGDNPRMADRLKALNARVAELKGKSGAP